MVHKTDLNSLYWDGTFMGKKLPNETYVYRVFFQDGNLKIDVLRLKVMKKTLILTMLEII